jgi:cytosine/adenosine deaminase-related metal-dependent hydrolase
MLTLAHFDWLYPMTSAPLQDAYLIMQGSEGGGTVLAMGTGEPPNCGGSRWDMHGTLALPGLVNSHHHLFQTLTRGYAPNQGLFAWLQSLFPLWGHLNPEAIYQSALIGLAELMLSGCTTTSDHLYIVPEGQDSMRFFEATIEAAKRLGIRLYVTRGAMTRGWDHGGRGPSNLIEDEDTVLQNMQDLVNRHHDPSPLAQIKVALSPVSLPAVSARFMKETARLAETLDVRLHTHGWETLDERQWVQNVYGTTELALFDEWGWLQDRTWFAHAVHANKEVIDLLGQRNVAISHCPTSNMRLGSGIAPIRSFLDAGNTVALGVDGSASNDGSHLLAEARQALLLARVLGGAAAMTVEEALHLATTQGAQALGWPEIGQLAVGLPADVAVFRIDDLFHSGAMAPLEALLFCQPVLAEVVVIGGEVRVWQSKIPGIDWSAEVARHQLLSRQLLETQK